jgi:hypothetical protein
MIALSFHKNDSFVHKIVESVALRNFFMRRFKGSSRKYYVPSQRDRVLPRDKLTFREEQS